MDSSKTKKLHSKLFTLTRLAKLEMWNGGDIKKAIVGGSRSKPFTCNGRKFKLEMVAETRCDNTTGFVPKGPVISVIDWRTGKGYTGVKQLSEFFGLSEMYIEVLYKDMCAMTSFSKEEIEERVINYNRAVKQFRSDYCLDS